MDSGRCGWGRIKSGKCGTEKVVPQTADRRDSSGLRSWCAVTPRQKEMRTKKKKIRHVPCCAREQTEDEGRLKRTILELLQKRRLVEGDASREGLAHHALTFGDEFGSEPGESLVSGRPKRRCTVEAGQGTGGRRNPKIRPSAAQTPPKPASPVSQPSQPQKGLTVLRGAMR